MILQKRNYKAFDLIRLAFKVAPNWALLTVILRLISALSPAVIIIATANFINISLAILEGNASVRDMYSPILFLGFFTSFRWLVNVFNKYIRSKFLIATRLTYRVDLIEKRGRLEYHHIENQDTYDLIMRITQSADTQIFNQFDNILVLNDVFFRVISLLAILIVDVWWAALLILICSMPAVYFGIKAGKSTYAAGRDVSRIERKAYYLMGVCGSRESVFERTLFGYGPKITDQLWERFEVARRYKHDVRVKAEIETAISTMSIKLIAGVIALILLQPVANGTITIGLFISLVTACIALSESFSWVPWQLRDFTKNLEYLKELSQFSQLEEIKDPLTTRCDKGFEFKKLEFKNVSFTYPGTHNAILNKVSFTIIPNRHYAFVGENGAGKTTVIKLLTGQYNNYEGEILLNGKELKEYENSELKAIFSVAYQDFAKYQISMKENILIGNSVADDAMLDEAIRSLDLNDLIAELPNGFNTNLGKINADGVDLSGGQWQRIALARTVINPAPIKILDEPTASLDPISESRLYGQFEKIIDNSTSIFISHRLGSIKLADEIFVFDGGTITEKGSHEMLMSKNNIYANMYKSQLEWYQTNTEVAKNGEES